MKEPPETLHIVKMLDADLEHARWQPKLKAQFREAMGIGFFLGLVFVPIARYFYGIWQSVF